MVFSYPVPVIVALHWHFSVKWKGAQLKRLNFPFAELGVSKKSRDTRASGRIERVTYDLALTQSKPVGIHYGLYFINMYTSPSPASHQNWLTPDAEFARPSDAGPPVLCR